MSNIHNSSQPVNVPGDARQFLDNLSSSQRTQQRRRPPPIPSPSSLMNDTVMYEYLTPMYNSCSSKLSKMTYAERSTCNSATTSLTSTTMPTSAPQSRYKTQNQSDSFEFLDSTTQQAHQAIINNNDTNNNEYCFNASTERRIPTCAADHSSNCQYDHNSKLPSCTTCTDVSICHNKKYEAHSNLLTDNQNHHHPIKAATPSNLDQFTIQISRNEAKTAISSNLDQLTIRNKPEYLDNYYENYPDLAYSHQEVSTTLPQTALFPHSPTSPSYASVPPNTFKQLPPTPPSSHKTNPSTFIQKSFNPNISRPSATAPNAPHISRQLSNPARSASISSRSTRASLSPTIPAVKNSLVIQDSSLPPSPVPLIPVPYPPSCTSVSRSNSIASLAAKQTSQSTLVSRSGSLTYKLSNLEVHSPVLANSLCSTESAVTLHHNDQSQHNSKPQPRQPKNVNNHEIGNNHEDLHHEHSEIYHLNNTDSDSSLPSTSSPLSQSEIDHTLSSVESLEEIIHGIENAIEETNKGTILSSSDIDRALTPRPILTPADKNYPNRVYQQPSSNHSAEVLPSTVETIQALNSQIQRSVSSPQLSLNSYNSNFRGQSLTQPFSLPEPAVPVHPRIYYENDRIDVLEGIPEAPPAYADAVRPSNDERSLPSSNNPSLSRLQSNASSNSSGSLTPTTRTPRSSMLLTDDVPSNGSTPRNGHSSRHSTSSSLQESIQFTTSNPSPSNTPSGKRKFWKIKPLGKQNSDIGTMTSVASKSGVLNSANRTTSMPITGTTEPARSAIRHGSSFGSISPTHTLEPISTNEPLDLIPFISNTKSSDLKLRITNAKPYYDIGDKVKGVLVFSRASKVAPGHVAVALVLSEQATKRSSLSRSSKKSVSRVVVLASCRQAASPNTTRSQFANENSDSGCFTFDFELEIPETYPQHHQLPHGLQRRIPPSFVTIEQEGSSDPNSESNELYETETNTPDNASRSPKDKSKAKKEHVPSTISSAARTFPGIKISYNILGLVSTKKEIPSDQYLVPFLTQVHRQQLTQQQLSLDDELVVQNSLSLNVQPSYTPIDFETIEREAAAFRTTSSETFGTVGANDTSLFPVSPYEGKKVYKASTSISEGGLLRNTVKIGIAEVHIIGLQYYSIRDEKPGSPNEENDGDSVCVPPSPTVPNTNEGASIGLNFLYFPDPGSRNTNIPMIDSVAMILRCRQVVSLSKTPFTSYPTSAYVSSTANVYERKQEVTIYEKSVWHSKWLKMPAPDHFSKNSKIYWTSLELPFFGIRDLQNSTKYQKSIYNLQIVPSYVSAYSCRDYEVDIIVKFDPMKTVKMTIPLSITSAMVPKSSFPWAKHPDENNL